MRGSKRFPMKSAPAKSVTLNSPIGISMDDRQSIDLAAMLCSRLCHDMLSPVGALSNGLELLAMETDPEMRANVVELLNKPFRAESLLGALSRHLGRH